MESVQGDSRVHSSSFVTSQTFCIQEHMQKSRRSVSFDPTLLSSAANAAIFASTGLYVLGAGDSFVSA